MPSAKPDLAALNLDQLVTLTGRTYRTVKRRLAGIEPIRTTGTAIYYDPQTAIPAILKPASAPPTARTLSARQRVLDMRTAGYAINEAASATNGILDWPTTCQVFDLTDRQLELWVTFGCPVSRRPKGFGSRAGWQFVSGFVIRWVALFSVYLQSAGLIKVGQIDFTAVLEELAKEAD